MKILFIDDEAERALPIVEYLQWKDNEVEFKSKIFEAFVYFQKFKNNIDIVILDIMMPVFEDDIVILRDSNNNVIEAHSSGLSLYNRFQKEMPLMRNIPIVILSARKNIIKTRPDLALLRTENKIAILEKPVEMKELLETLNNLNNHSKRISK